MDSRAVRLLAAFLVGALGVWLLALTTVWAQIPEPIAGNLRLALGGLVAGCWALALAVIQKWRAEDVALKTPLPPPAPEPAQAQQTMIVQPQPVEKKE